MTGFPPGEPASSVDGVMQRPGEPADPPSPWTPPAPPWAAEPTATAPAPPRATQPAGPAPLAAQPAGDAPAPPYPPYGTPGQPGPYGTPGQPGPYGAPGEPGPYGAFPRPRPRLWPPARREWTTAVAAILALAALGAVLAIVWVQLAPRLQYRVDQPGRALPVVPEAEEYVAADGRFVLLTLAAGVLAGIVCWLVRRSRGPLVLVALAVGGLLGAVVTWRLGVRLGTGYQPADLQVVGRIVEQPLRLRARAALVVEPVAAVVVYLLAVGFSSRTDLGREEDQVSSGSA